MSVQTYLIVQQNVVTNIILWDGGPEWTPPNDATMLIKSEITANISFISSWFFMLTRVKVCHGMNIVILTLHVAIQVQSSFKKKDVV